MGKVTLRKPSTTYNYRYIEKAKYVFVLLPVITGIGRDIAVTLYKRGAQVVALSRTQADLDSLKVEVRAHHCPLQNCVSEKV